MGFTRTVVLMVMVTAAALAAFAAEGDWTLARYDEAGTGYTPEQVALPLTLCWQYDTSRFTGNTSTPAVAGGVVYFAAGSKLFALDAATGTLKWRYPSTDTLGFNIRTGITIWEDLLLFGGTDGHLYALSADTGRLVWRFPTRGPIRSAPVVTGGTVFVGSDDNSLYAVDARTGTEVWTSGFRTKDDVHAAPAIAPGLVIFASMDSNVYAANVATGRTRWMYQLPMSPVRSAPVVVGNFVFIGAGRAICALSLKNGMLRYSIPLPSDIASPPAAAGEELYIICRNKKLYSYFVGMTGAKLRWTAPVDIGVSSTAPPTIAGDAIFVACNRGYIGAYSTEDGKLLWSYTASPSLAGNNNQKVEVTDIAAPAVIAGGCLYVVADDGSLRCFRNQAADDTPPEVDNVYPRIGAAMSGSPPIPVVATLSDESTGVDPNSVQLLLDDKPVEGKFDVKTSKLTYETPITQPIQQLSDGRHSLTIEAKDWKGNTLNHTWSFFVDNTLPAPPPPKAKERKAPPPKQPRRGQTGTGATPPTPPTPPGGPVGPGDTRRGEHDRGSHGSDWRGGREPGPGTGPGGPPTPPTPPAPPGPPDSMWREGN